MPNTTRLLLAAAALSALAVAGPADAAPAGVKVGVLSCHVDRGWGFVFGSSKDMQCAFHSDRGEADYYSGTISKLGVDIGYTGGGEIVWDVVAPTLDAGIGALQGDYAGATVGVTVLAGVGAHVLFGGFDNSIALQPVSVEGNSGLDVAVGAGAITLRAVSAAVPKAVSFEVVFDPDKVYLPPTGGAAVEDAVRAAQETGLMRVRVIGAVDAVKSNPDDDAISNRRVLAVRNELLRDGLINASISIEGRSGPRVLPDPAARNRENDRVTIELTPPSLSDTSYR